MSDQRLFGHRGERFGDRDHLAAVEGVEPAAVERRRDAILVGRVDAQRDGFAPAANVLQRRGGALEHRGATLARQLVQTKHDKAAARFVERMSAAIDGMHHLGSRPQRSQLRPAVERGGDGLVEPADRGQFEDAVLFVARGVAQHGLDQIVVDRFARERHVDASRGEGHADPERPAGGPFVEVVRLDRQLAHAGREPARNRQQRRVANCQDPADAGLCCFDQGAEQRDAARFPGQVVQLIEYDRRRYVRQVLARPSDGQRFAVALLQLSRRRSGRACHRGTDRSERGGEPAQQFAGRAVFGTGGEAQVRDGAERQIVADQRALPETLVRDDERDRRAQRHIEARIQTFPWKRPLLRLGDDPSLDGGESVHVDLGWEGPRPGETRPGSAA